MTLQKNDDGTYSVKMGPLVGSLVVGLFIYLLGQSVIALRWGSSLDTRVAAIETFITERKGRDGIDLISEREIQIRLARLEERLVAIYNLLQRSEVGRPLKSPTVLTTPE